MSKPACNRIHLGPVAAGTRLCQNCMKVLTPEERVVYWNIRKRTLEIIIAAEENLAQYIKKKRPTV